MKMKNFKNFIITLSLTAIMSFVILSCASKIFMPKWIDEEGNRMAYIIKGFYLEPKNSIDVLFTGNSDVFRGVSPMSIYEKTGFTSYNYTSAGQRMWIASAMLEEALRVQKPKIVFFNVDELYYTSKSVGNAHKVYDNMRFGWPKVKGVLDSNYKNGGRWSHFFPVVAYHDRYKELSFDDFKYAFYDYTDPLKGMDLIAYSKPYKDENDYMAKTTSSKTFPEKNRQYLDSMRKLCEQKGIEFVLMEIPSPDSWSYEKHNAVLEYANEYKLKFLDLNLHLDEIGIDWNTDTADGGDHLNVFGAEKVSAYLANYLEENFNLDNHKGDKKYERWNDQYKEYLEFKEQKIASVRG